MLIVFCEVNFDRAIGQSEQQYVYGFGNLGAAFDSGFSEKPVIYQGPELLAVNFEGNDDRPAVASVSIPAGADGGRGKGGLWGHSWLVECLRACCG